MCVCVCEGLNVRKRNSRRPMERSDVLIVSVVDVCVVRLDEGLDEVQVSPLSSLMDGLCAVCHGG